MAPGGLLPKVPVKPLFLDHQNLLALESLLAWLFPQHLQVHRFLQPQSHSHHQNDVIKLQKKYKKPNNTEKKALEALVKTLDKCNDEMSPEDIQTLIYSTGKENGYSENLRDWFKLIYEVVFGDENGPRMGFFISFFGVKETKDLILNKIK